MKGLGNITRFPANSSLKGNKKVKYCATFVLLITTLRHKLTCRFSNDTTQNEYLVLTSDLHFEIFLKFFSMKASLIEQCLQSSFEILSEQLKNCIYFKI